MGMLKKQPSETVSTLLDDVAQPDVSKKGKKRKQQEVEGSLANSVVEPAVLVDSSRPEKKQRKKEAAEAAAAAAAPAAAASAPDANSTTVVELDPAEYRAKNFITSENDLPDPVQTFDSAPFGKKLRLALKSAGFAAPTPIQAQAWPLAVRGDDLVSVAKTGSGKTLVFLLPAFRMIQKGQFDGSDGPVALVLAPTRELAMQIEQVAVKFGAVVDIKTTIVYGGVPKPPQVKALKAKPQVVVATPGRLMDLMQEGSVNVGNVAYLVLDEADRMLDMGFEPQMEAIMKNIPAERQTVLFSATWPKSVKKLASKYLKKDAVSVNVGETQELSANKAVSQEFFPLDDDEKERKLWRILYDMGENTKIIIFANTKNRINKLQKEVWKNGYDCIAMHGDKTQQERDESLKKFISGEVPVMLATDVCARGLDIKDVTHVLNFDMARDVESYIHRIGRTGRAGVSGVSITFFNRAYDMECAPALAKIAAEAGQVVPDFLDAAAKKTTSVKNKAWKY